ncbi:hypothetical protein J2809_000607 [Arthrobacter pascens]|nr:hypothetical protein [Arthrobacter pascens]
MFGHRPKYRAAVTNGLIIARVFFISEPVF